MKKTYNLKLALIVIVVIMSLAIGAEDWLSPILMGLNIYYGIFTLNLFFILYEKENFITKIFFEVTSTPSYIAGAVLAIVIIFLRRLFPEMDFDPAYLSALIGITASTIGRIKRKEWKVRS